MESLFTSMKIFFVVIATFVSVRFGILAPLLALLITALVVDYISGMIASAIKGELSSKKGIIGILKKLGYIFAVVVALIADELIIFISSQFDINILPKATFAILITIWLTLNELLSIIENLGRMGVPLPKFLKRIILILKDTVDSESEK